MWAALLVSASTLGAQVGSPEVSGGATIVGQATSDSRARPEIVASFDLFVEVPLGRGRLVTYAEANTTPRLNGVSRLVGEANTDAGTALNRRRRGRVQLSEVRLVWPLASDFRAHGGLLDATGFLDVSRIANDENLFFLGVPFVNNPTIEFPDYALGVAMEGAISGPLRGAFTITSTHGLADNPNVSYSQLLDLNGDGKGVFAGGALRWVGPAGRVSVGTWVRSAAVPRLDGAGPDEVNSGAFAVVGRTRGQHSLSFRTGIASGAVSAVRGFTGLTYLWARRPDAIGVGLGRSFSSNAVPDLVDVTHGEVFVRRRLFREVFVTVSGQRIINAGFDASSSVVSRKLWVGGFRLSTQF